MMMKMAGLSGDYENADAMQMQCLPLYSVVKAVGRLIIGRWHVKKKSHGVRGRPNIFCSEFAFCLQ